MRRDAENGLQGHHHRERRNPVLGRQQRAPAGSERRGRPSGGQARSSRAAYFLTVLKVLASIPFVLLGVVMVGSGWSMLDEASDLSGHGRSTTGVVVSREWVTSGMGSTPKIDVSFVAFDGTRHVVRHTGDERVGARIKVLYDPANPDKSSVEPVASQRGLGVFLIVCGVIFTVGTPCLFGWGAMAEARIRGSGGTPR
ncbi:DUF3592 domain-containing protein [Nonomuraea basaltis]|nr:DUF3592 domain-containing protein [Nonomuraea basaltis]